MDMREVTTLAIRSSPVSSSDLLLEFSTVVEYNSVSIMAFSLYIF